MSEKQPKPVNETELENVESEDSVDATTEQAEQNIEAELNAEAENISEEQQKINELELTLAAVKSIIFVAAQLRKLRKRENLHLRNSRSNYYLLLII